MRLRHPQWRGSKSGGLVQNRGFHFERDRNDRVASVGKSQNEK
jgi:hypothetical protein